MNERQGMSPRTSDQDFVTPAANIVTRGNEYILELELPGVNRQGLEISIEGNELRIVGRRQMAVPQGELCYCESNPADFRRVFEVGPDVDASKISAEMQQGILTLRLPKAEQAKPRKIEIAG